MSFRNTSPIAVIGVSVELPSGSKDHNLDYDSFWPFLLGKGEAYSEIPSDRFNSEAYVFSLTSFIYVTYAMSMRCVIIYMTSI